MWWLVTVAHVFTMVLKLFLDQLDLTLSSSTNLLLYLSSFLVQAYV